MKGYIENIEEKVLANTNFREVLYTAHYMQLVVMTIPVGGEIGKEVHGQDQFIRVEQGTGKATLDGKEHAISKDFVVFVPSGAEHNIENTGDIDLKVYTLYAAPHHTDKKIHKTKKEADADDSDEFLGDTTEK